MDMTPRAKPVNFASAWVNSSVQATPQAVLDGQRGVLYCCSRTALGLFIAINIHRIRAKKPAAVHKYRRQTPETRPWTVGGALIVPLALIVPQFFPGAAAFP